MSIKTVTHDSDQMLAQVIARPTLVVVEEEYGNFVMDVIRRGRKIDEVPFPNMVVNQMLNYRRSVGFLDGTKITSWFLFLVATAPVIAATDTYASRPGWTELTGYNETTRRAWVGLATGTAGEISNAASPAEFTITSNSTVVGGAGLCGGGASANVKGDTAGAGTLACVGALPGGDRTLQANDLLRITYIYRGSRPS